MNALRAWTMCFVALGAFACWAVALVSMLLASQSRLPGAPRPAALEGRFDVMYLPSLLTPEGRRHRRRCLVAIAGFVVCWSLGVLLGQLSRG